MGAQHAPERQDEKYVVQRILQRLAAPQIGQTACGFSLPSDMVES